MSVPSENPTYKLYYFNVKALAEPIRFLLAYGGLKYEDVRFAEENWPELKSTFPFGQVPVLEVDGLRVHQSIPISRYLSKRVGLSGKNDWEDLAIDIAVDTINDFRGKIAVVHYESDQTVKNTKLAPLSAETIPFYLEKLEAIAKENNGHFALGRLTWVDLYFVAILDYLKYMVKSDLLAKYPSLQAVVNNVLAVESIKEWVSKRPETDL